MFSSLATEEAFPRLELVPELTERVHLAGGMTRRSELSAVRRRAHHGAAGRLAALERLESGGNVDKLDLPTDHRANCPARVRCKMRLQMSTPCAVDRKFMPNGRAGRGESAYAKQIPRRSKFP